MIPQRREGRGRTDVDLLCELLEGAWRRGGPGPLMDEEELARAMPVILASGAAALAWTRIRASALAGTEEGAKLREAYRYASLRDVVRSRETRSALAIFRDRGIDAVLMKGWAVARLYHDPAVRPHGDVDVWVRSAQYQAALALVPELERLRCWVDLHESPFELRHRSPEMVFARTETVIFDGEEVRILCPEDQLALLCIHMLRHGGWRPLWLCDIAAAVESRPDNFDWELSLGSDARRAQWCLSAIALAHRLVGLDIGGTPAEAAANNLPPWLIEAVTRAWENPDPGLQPPMRHRAPIATYLRRPAGLLRDLRARWPNEIEASIYTGAPLDSTPRLPYQIRYGVARGVRFLRSLRRPPHSPDPLPPQGGKGEYTPD